MQGILSTITDRGQTVVPAAIRQAFALTPSHKLQWIVSNDGIRVVPVKADAITAFRGSGKGGTTSKLLADRALERSLERR